MENNGWEIFAFFFGTGPDFEFVTRKNMMNDSHNIQVTVRSRDFDHDKNYHR